MHALVGAAFFALHGLELLMLGICVLCNIATGGGSAEHVVAFEASLLQRLRRWFLGVSR